MRCLCICVSVCLSVTFVDCVKTNKRIFKIVSPSGSVTFGRLAVSDYELGVDVIVLLIYCDVRFCILVHFRWAVHSKRWNIGVVAGPMYI